ncbi:MULTISPECIES: ankyrin repeat domain-containing protein [Bacillus]|uniref:ankyrin repeat domain-containing protein n=1 Tax=Bacillus TaxID=1386 RepID=UPI0009361231|nr:MULTISPECIES: ankyrin repeat domain-containing protein [Bacillus cereus group]MBL3753916.1 ankyrin repeat domain-containing protein [Bacillus cereus]MCC2411443.1 ankyrin repeat domain-containing protein [Bacillus paranthracis]MCU5205550.1 ankyrin repeat domain-containing protein [Bacillus paranthracis]MDA2161094.1 ankyrin repeat domain-containing protein [Bacillus cereus group sp. Bc252]MDF9509668.1 ankyrin repeat domain-containing protein [Bacillus paranthracis]
MDINKADYGTIIKFGNLKLFLEKLKIEGNCIEEIVDSIDKNGISLLEKSLISRKFDIANFLLDNGAKVNIISNDGCNEFHYLAANINCQGAVEVACRLVDMGVDLNLKDKKFGNSAIWSLCQEVLKKRTKEGNDLIVKCLGKRPNINDENKYGYSLRDLIEERGTDDMKKVLEMIV